MNGEQLANELHKPIAKKSKKHKVYSFYLDNTGDVDIADMQLIRKYIKGIAFLLCVIDIYSKYAWVVPLKNKKGITVIDAFKISWMRLVVNQKRYR